VQSGETKVDIKNPDYLAAMRAIFQEAAFIQDLGIELVDVQPGLCITELVLAPRHMQHHRLVHAGVQATMADHSAGGAASTLIAADERVLTVEFKINLLRAAIGDKLLCEARVLRPGKTLTVVESEVYAITGERRELVSKAMVTLMTLKMAGESG
jgi:uncharacterized protein (TIGR00369 family)